MAEEKRERGSDDARARDERRKRREPFRRPRPADGKAFPYEDREMRPRRDFETK